MSRALILHAALLSLSPVMSFAQDSQSSGCADASKLRNICMYLEGRDEWESAPEPYKYVYQQKLLEASCADVSRDSAALVAQKVASMWSRLPERLTCTNLQFDVHRGSIVKFGVATQFDTFISDVTRWKVHLNQIDPADGKTVLDYVEYHRLKNRGNPVEAKMAKYQKWLVDAGAKHAADLR